MITYTKQAAVCGGTLCWVACIIILLFSFLLNGLSECLGILCYFHKVLRTEVVWGKGSGRPRNFL